MNDYGNRLVKIEGMTFVDNTPDEYVRQRKLAIKNYNAMSESDRYNDAYLAGYRQCVVDFQKQKNLASAENTN